MRCKACLGKSGLRRIQGLREKANTNGYIMINVGGKRYYEHRLVMQLHLNRPLLDSEHVHHINGNKIDNRLENLEIMLKSDHHKLHSNPEKMKKMSIMAHKIKRIKNAPTYEYFCEQCSKQYDVVKSIKEYDKKISVQ